MAYKPFTLEVEGKTISLHSGRDSLTRTFGDENTAAQRFGETRKTVIEALYLLMD